MTTGMGRQHRVLIDYWWPLCIGCFRLLMSTFGKGTRYQLRVDPMFILGLISPQWVLNASKLLEIIPGWSLVWVTIVAGRAMQWVVTRGIAENVLLTFKDKGHLRDKSSIRVSSQQRAKSSSIALSGSSRQSTWWKGPLVPLLFPWECSILLWWKG